MRNAARAEGRMGSPRNGVGRVRGVYVMPPTGPIILEVETINTEGVDTAFSNGPAVACSEDGNARAPWIKGHLLALPMEDVPFQVWFGRLTAFAACYGYGNDSASCGARIIAIMRSSGACGEVAQNWRSMTSWDSNCENDWSQETSRKKMSPSL
jgi:hypothetical protein